MNLFNKMPFIKISEDLNIWSGKYFTQLVDLIKFESSCKPDLKMYSPVFIRMG